MALVGDTASAERHRHIARVKSTLLNDPVLSLIAGVWLFYLSTIFLRFDAVVPDEMLFIAHAQGLSVWDAYTSPPKYGYGPLYWAVMAALGSIPAARTFAFVLFASVPLAILLTARSSQIRVSLLLLWLSFPVAYWGGKLIGPELWTLALCAAAIAAYHHRKIPLAGLLSGVAIGIKIVTLPIAVVIGLMIALTPATSARTVAVFILASILGILVAYPTLAIYPPPPGGFRPLELQTFVNMFTLFRWEWDAIFSGGFLRFFLAVPAFLVVILIGAVRAPRLGIPILAGTAVLAIMLIGGGSQYGWYGFSLIAPSLYLAAQALPLPALLAVVVINVSLQLPLIAAMVQQKADQHRALSDPGTLTCLQGYLDKTTRTRVLDMAEFGLALSWPERIVRVRYWGIPTAETQSADAALVMTRMLVADIAGRQIYENYRIAQSCPHSLVLERP